MCISLSANTVIEWLVGLGTVRIGLLGSIQNWAHRQARSGGTGSSSLRLLLALSDSLEEGGRSHGRRAERPLLSLSF